MKLVEASDPILRQKMPESFILNILDIENMFKLMFASIGVGLAAPQVGIRARLFVTHWGEVFINPVITSRSTDIVKEAEGCLSLPGQKIMVPRYVEINVGGKFYGGFQARVIQHEMDHLDGKLITDYDNS